MRSKNVLAAAALAMICLPVVARAELLFAINTNNQLVRFDHTAPGLAVTVGLVTLDGVQTPLSMDFRATDGNLYVLGSGGTIYTINPNTAGLVSTVSTPYPAGTITGPNYEIDFNPVPNALRIINSNGQNLRVAGGQALNTGITDTTYPAPPGPPAPGATPVGDAYNNNDVNPATGTVLFILDDATDSLYQVADPNDPDDLGDLINRGTLGTSISGLTPFDISQTNQGYLVVGSTLFSVDVVTPGEVNNRAISLGTIGPGGGLGPFKALSAVTAPVPEPSTLAMFALGLAGAGLRRWRRR